jgi:eukaryotic-like serine/threonine-protein kinase
MMSGEAQADRWDTLSGWLETWRTASADERVRLRDQFARDHPGLLAEATALAAASEEVSGFLETPALVLAARQFSQPDPPFAAGSMIGPYRLEGFLARGGMGDVYRAVDTRLQRPVAIKMLSQTKTGDPQRVARFMTEARVTAGLEHPNIVRVYDVGLIDDRAYLVAELLDGETLRHRIERGPLPIDDVVRIGIEVAAGLTAAHAAGLVHRDLKPDNVFLTRAGDVKILDFGIAKLAQDETVRDGFSTLTGVVLGTAGYLAPEQIRGATVDARTDLFALGAVLSEMLTGARAFPREHIVETLHAILHERPTDVLSARPDVPPALAGVVTRLLEKTPEARFGSAADVMAALERVDVHATAGWVGRNVHSVHQRLHRSFRGRRRTVMATGVLLAAVTAGVIWRFGSGAGGPTSTVTLAIMPFTSIPANEANKLLEVGLADVLISRLSQLSNLRVLSATATERLRNDAPAEVAKKLGANYVLTVTLQRDARQVRAVPALVGASADPIWSTTIDTDAASVFSVQDIIVTKVVEELTPRLSARMRSKLATPGTRNSQAFEAYARGRAYVLNPTRADLTRAKELFEAALTLDPNYADAWASLGSAYKRMPIAAQVPGKDAFPHAKNAALRALQLDPDHAEAHSVMGTVAFWFDWDYARAEKELRRALELQPSSADSELFLGHLLANTGRAEESLAAIRRARAFDPEWLLARAQEGHFLYMARRYQEALATLDATITIAPRFWPPHQMRILVLDALGRYDDAIAETELRTSLGDGPASDGLTQRAYAFVKTGRRAEAEALLTTLLTQRAPRRGTGTALVLHALGRDDEAIQELQALIERRDHSVTLLGVYPGWDDLRDDPAFRRILQQVNLLDVSDRVRR